MNMDSFTSKYTKYTKLKHEDEDDHEEEEEAAPSPKPHQNAKNPRSEWLQYLFKRSRNRS
jgi:hypothetical protein